MKNTFPPQSDTPGFAAGLRIPGYRLERQIGLQPLVKIENDAVECGLLETRRGDAHGVIADLDWGKSIDTADIGLCRKDQSIVCAGKSNVDQGQHGPGLVLHRPGNGSLIHLAESSS